MKRATPTLPAPVQAAWTGVRPALAAGFTAFRRRGIFVAVRVPAHFCHIHISLTRLCRLQEDTVGHHQGQ